MFDTYVTVVGTALTAPEWRRTRNSTLVANFRVASRSRRFDREQGVWIDGDSVRVRVNCWRRLAESVVTSVMVGDPVIVTGRLYTRDWTTPAGERRLAYELEATAVGHDLSRGQGSFVRFRGGSGTGVGADEESEPQFSGPAVSGDPGADAPGSGSDPGPAPDLEADVDTLDPAEFAEPGGSADLSRLDLTGVPETEPVPPVRTDADQPVPV